MDIKFYPQDGQIPAMGQNARYCCVNVVKNTDVLCLGHFLPLPLKKTCLVMKARDQVSQVGGIWCLSCLHCLGRILIWRYIRSISIQWTTVLCNWHSLLNRHPSVQFLHWIMIVSIHFLIYRNYMNLNMWNLGFMLIKFCIQKYYSKYYLGDYQKGYGVAITRASTRRALSHWWKVFWCVIDLRRGPCRVDKHFRDRSICRRIEFK